jgi:CHAT domain-containing protein/tetratricopeptide (TPR) repeat protein
LSKKYPLLYLLLTAIFVAAAVWPKVSVALADQQSTNTEYFVQQAPDEDILITINAFEAEFESVISGEAGKVLVISGIPGSRLVPVFQYVLSAGKGRQLDIKVNSSLNTGRSQFGLELTRLTIWDERSKAVARAYQLLSFGMETSRSTSAADWSVKIDSLLNAGRVFQQFGMKEMRLWSNYIAAHLIHFHLHDHGIVYNMTREILTDLKGSRLQKVELATLKLQSAALIGLKRSGTLNVRANTPDPVQAALSRVAVLANSMGFYFEQAWAFNTSGVEYAVDLDYARALQQFQLAVQIADSVGDSELAKDIRESTVQIHAAQGNTPASGEVLREIETQLVEEGGGDELALNLLAQGRLLIRNYLYDQAADVLSQALAYENSSGIRRQINFELARVFYETGRLDESMVSLRLAKINMDGSQQKRINTVIDVGEGLRIMSDIHRAKGEFAQMRKARNAQGRYKPIAANYLYQQGLDELAQTDRTRQKAQSLFRRSHEAATNSGLVDLKHLSHLQVCALGNTGNGLCSNAGLRTAYTSLLDSGIPRLSAQAMVLWAQIQVLNGQHSAAIDVMSRLVDEIHFLRLELPGVLGAWYREHRETMFEYYLGLMVSDSAHSVRDEASASLLALSKIRQIEKDVGSDSILNTDSGKTELLRIQLAQRAKPEPRQNLTVLTNEVNRGLSTLRLPFKKKYAYLSKTGLQKYLRSLTANERLLTWHISRSSAQVWIGQKSRVQRFNIANPASVYKALQEARQNLANTGISSFNARMDALGKRLLEPVARLLSDNIYWVPAGPLLGFPLDALRLNGRYLAESHSVVNLLSFPANINPGASLQTGPLKNVFLAGNPQDYTGDYAVRLETSPEIRSVTDIFVGPGLRIVQGAALLPDEFQSVDFLKANLVHLTMPGIVDLRHPGQSRLELSESEYAPGRTSYGPKDIRSTKLNARLVFLSKARLENQPLSAFASHPGLISDFAVSGARSVIADLWASDGARADAFVRNFYRELNASGNAATAMSAAKRQYLFSHSKDGLFDWAGYQLFID